MPPAAHGLPPVTHAPLYSSSRPPTPGIAALQKPPQAYLSHDLPEKPRIYPLAYDRPLRSQAESISSKTTFSSSPSSPSSPSAYKSHTPKLGVHTRSPTSPSQRSAASGERSPLSYGQPHAQFGTTNIPEMTERGLHSQGGNVPLQTYVQQAAEEEDEKEHGVWILFWLSVLDPFFSLVSAVYSTFLAFIILLASPLSFCRPQCNIGNSIVRSIAPLLRQHLKLLCAESVDDAHTFDFNPGTLVAIQLFSPVLSIGAAVAAWTAGCFWLFALMMGNPDGLERGDDGKQAVLAVRNWYEAVLLKALR